MGAYFIRRRSRGALYRKVLARYVQMATEGGVAQGIFPEGGLSLTGHAMRPKLGLLSYIVEGHDTSNRDVVFVPVAINYDRVLEDRVLIAAAERGDRRFGARISVVVMFILRKFWQAARGRYERFGRAAVVFGAPLSLRADGQNCDVEELAADLMVRIADVMPVLIVPLLARALQDSATPLTTEQFVARLQEDVQTVGLHMPAPDVENLPAAVEAGLRELVRHNVIVQTEAGWSPLPGQDALLAFYANSIMHRFAKASAAAQ